MAKDKLTFYIPGPDGATRKDAFTTDVGKYLARVAASYPEGTLAVHFTGGGTRQYRKHYSKAWELVRQTVGP